MAGLPAWGQAPEPATIRGTVTVDDAMSGFGQNYRIEATLADGTAFDPPAADTDGVDLFGMYYIRIPIYDPEEQPQGVEPGSTVILHLYQEDTELQILSPASGEVIVEESGSMTIANIEATTEDTPPVVPGDNSPPTAAAGPDRNVLEGATVRLDASNSSDPDPGDTLTYLWEQTEGTPQITLTDANKAVTTFQAPVISGESTSLTFQLTVKDADGQSSTDTVIVNISKTTSANYPPTADAGPYQTVKSGDIVTLDGSNSTDRENNIVSYEWEQIGGPDVALSASNVLQPTFTAPEIEGTGGAALTFELTVTDAGELRNTDRVTINVTTQNRPPVAEAGSYQTATEGEVITLDGSGSSDPDDGISGYEWSQLTGPAVSLSDPTALQPNFTAPDVDAGGASLTFELIVTDNGGLKNADRVTINVTYENQPPTAEAGEDQTVAEGTAVTLDGTNSIDMDNGIDTYKWSQLEGPAVTLATPAEAQTTFTAPDVGTEGATLIFELEVTDKEELKAADQVTITVTFVNSPPVAEAGENRMVMPGSQVQLDAAGSTDPDEQDLTYAWTQLEGEPQLELTGADTATPTFTAPEIEEDQRFLFQLEVADSEEEKSTDTVEITVSQNANKPPVADAGEDQTVLSGAVVTLDGSASADPEEEALSYTWSQIDEGQPIMIQSPNTASATFTAPAVEEETVFTFQLTVEDSAGLTAQETVIVRVNPAPVNAPPIANAGEDRTVVEGTVVTLDASASTDPDDDIVSYRWSQVDDGAPVVASLQGASSAQATFTAPDVTDPQNNVLTFELAVTDSAANRTTDRVSVTITPPVNQPPTPDAGERISTVEGETVTLDGTGSTDPDGAITGYHWEQVEGPAVTLSDPASSQPTFVAPPVEAGEILLSFSLTVKDNAEQEAVSEPVHVMVFNSEFPGYDPNVIPFAASTDKFVGITVEGGAMVGLWPIEATTISETAGRPGALPYGLMDMAIKIPEGGNAATVRFQLPEPALAGYTWYRFNAQEGWKSFGDKAVFTPERNVATLTLTDGGAEDDNGNPFFIRVLAGPGSTPVIPPEEPEEPQDNGGGGGDGDSNCFIRSLTR